MPLQATTVLLLIVDRPNSAPLGVLVIVVSIAAVHLTTRLNDASNLRISDLSSILAIFVSLGAVTVILCMPLGIPVLPTDQLSRPFTPPTHKVRSPEDRLTPWQFMSVSWISPLISVGSTRQLEDEDVWSLSYEFQHKGLHERFRELKGSFVKRLLKANGIDLLILTSLGLIEQVAST